MYLGLEELILSQKANKWYQVTDLGETADTVACCEVLSSPSGHRADDSILKVTGVFTQVGSRYPHSSTPVWKWRIFFHWVVGHFM